MKNAILINILTAYTYTTLLESASCSKQQHPRRQARAQRRYVQEATDTGTIDTYAPLTALLYQYPIDPNIGAISRGQVTVSHINFDGSSSPINTEQDNGNNSEMDAITTVYDATLEYTLTGIIPNSKGVIYISQGTTCDGEINYDPFWNSDVVESNPWYDEHGEEASTKNNSYTSNAVGEASGLFTYSNGHDHEDHYEHTVIVLDMATNDLVACGVLMTEIPFQPVVPVDPEVPSSVPSITSAMPLSMSSRPSNRPSEDIEDEVKGVNVSSSRIPTASPVVTTGSGGGDGDVSSAFRVIGSLSTTAVCSMVALWFISAM